MYNLWENHKEFIRNDKLILKSQHKFRDKKHNVFTKRVNKIALNANNDERKQSIDTAETYAYGTNKDLVRDKEEIKCNNIKNNTKKY